VANQTVSGSMVFPLTELNSGVSLRDKHMKEEYLETPKFPEAKLVIKELKLSGNPEKDGFEAKGFTFTGDFTVHGVTKPLTGTIDLKTANGETTGDANFDIKMSQYGFREAKWLGMSVNDDVQVKAHLQAKK
jgi:polyisoprenoid-binding protein YceI